MLERADHDPQSVSANGRRGYLGEYFRRLADQAPVVLLLEDLHWADEAMLVLIDAADAVLRDSRVLVVATTRPDPARTPSALGRGPRLPHAACRSSSLSRRETRQLLARDPPARPIRCRRALSDLVVTASEGNPFYVEELVKWLLEAGVITKEATMPGTCVDERLDQTRGARHVAERAAGQPRRAVARRAHGAAAGVGDRTDLLGRRRRRRCASTSNTAPARPTGRPSEALDRLRGREVVYQREQSAFEHTREFLFKHALLRDVAYDGVLRRHRQTYHGLAARWFEQMVERTRRADEYAGLIADHHANAGDREAAARWYLVAGRQAASVDGLADARRLLAWDSTLASRVGHARCASTCCWPTSRCSTGSATAPAQQADLDDPRRPRRRRSTTPTSRIRLLLTRCRWTFHHSEYGAEEAAAHEAIELARRTGLPELENEARLWMGKGLTWTGRHQAARDALDQALAGARALGQRRVITESLRYLAIVANNVSEFPRAEALLDEAIATAPGGRTTPRARASRSSSWRPCCTTPVVSPRPGRASSRRCPIVVASGFRYREAVVVSNLAAIVIQHGELGRARRLIARGLELCLELEDNEGAATALNILGDIHWRVGEVEEAEAVPPTVTRAAPHAGSEVVSSDTLLSLALIAAQRGDLDDALAHVDDSLVRGRRSGSALAVARSLVGRGYVLLARGEVDQAGESLRAGLAEAERLDLAYLVVEAEAALAGWPVLRGDRDEGARLAERVLENLGRPDLTGAIQPSEIYRTCWRVLVDLRRAPRRCRARVRSCVPRRASPAGSTTTRCADAFLRLPTNLLIAG